MVWRWLLLFPLLFLTCAVGHAAQKVPAHANVVVMDIGEYGNLKAQGFNATASVTDYVIAALAKESEFQLYSCDPEVVRDMLAESGMKDAGLSSLQAAAEISSLFHADYIVYGKIHDLGLSEGDTSVPFYNNERYMVTANIVLRMVNARTGAIVMAAKGKGEAASSSNTVDYVNIAALALQDPDLFRVNGTLSTGGTRASSDDVKTALQAASTDAVVNLMDHLQGKNRKRGNRG